MEGGYGMKYHDEVLRNNTILLRERLGELPSFAKDFFRAIEPVTSSRTRIAYAYDLGVFFGFLQSENSYFATKDISKITLEDIEKLRSVDIEEFLEYLKLYKKDGMELSNNASGQMRKLATLRSFYNYYYQKEMIKNNPAVLVSMPKLSEKNIIRLEGDEISRLLKCIDSGEGLTEHQLRYHAKTKVRDLAIISLLLGTGIRVSECVGLNVDDIDFKSNAISILRKGGNEAFVYFADNIKDYLRSYYEQRKLILSQKGSETAFFLSSQQSRLTVRSIENMVKKYAKIISPLKKITPHKLRSTFGTSLYRQTGDIYLVADVLGHKDVNTTRKHYADQSEKRKKEAGRSFKLLSDEEE